MGVALFTTLFGLVGGILLKLQYYILDEGTSYLFGLITELTEVSGTADISEEQKSASRDALQELEAPEELTSGQFDVDVFPDKEQILQFDEMPTPILPEKDMI